MVVHVVASQMLCCIPRLFGYFRSLSSGYFSRSCSSISLNQSAHSPLTSSINKAFLPTGLPHTGCFLLFHTILCKPYKWLCVKSNLARLQVPSNLADCEILRQAHLAPTTMPPSKLLKSPFFPILTFSFIWSSGDCLDQDHTPKCIEATAMWLVDSLIALMRNWTGVPNNPLGERIWVTFWEIPSFLPSWHNCNRPS